MRRGKGPVRPFSIASLGRILPSPSQRRSLRGKSFVAERKSSSGETGCRAGGGTRPRCLAASRQIRRQRRSRASRAEGPPRSGRGGGRGGGKKSVRPELGPFLQDEVEPLPFQKGQAEGDRQGGGFSGRQDSRIRPSEVFGETNVSSTAYSAPAPVATRHLSPAFIWRTRARWTASASSMRTVPSPMRDASV